MKRQSAKQGLYLGAAAGVLAVAGPAFAQSDPSDIVVTARRTEERLQDVPISITVFTQQALTDRNIVNSADIATYTPSLTTNSRFGVENTTFAIRGFTQEGITSPSVAVYFADVVAPRANGGTTAGNGAGPGSFFDLQNVQVLKGPQGTLFGRNTTGGAVLLVPQKPTSEFEGYVEGSYGNFDMYKVQGVLNVPISENVRLRVGVDHQKRDGFVRNLSGIGPDDFSDVNYVALRASLVVDVTPNLENYTIATYSDSDTNGFMPKVYATNFSARTSTRVRNAVNAQIAATPGFYDVLGAMSGAFQHIRQWSAINTTTWQASDTLTLKNIISYTQFRQSSRGNTFGEYNILSTNPTTPYFFGVGTTVVPGSNNVQQYTFTEEFQIQGRTSDDAFTYQLGAYLEKSGPLGGYQTTRSAVGLACAEINDFTCTDIGGRDGGAEGRVGNISESSSQYRFRNLGLYAQATYKLTEQLSVTGGIRYTSDRTVGRSQVLRGNFPTPNNAVWSCAVPAQITQVGNALVTNPTGLTQGGTSAQVRADPSRCDFTAKAKSSKPTWLLDVDFKPIDDILLYAKYARGYRQGSVNVSSYGLETWAPEKVDTYEVGAKTSFNGFVRGTFNVAAFYNDLSNQQLLLTAIGCTAAELITRPVQCPFVASAGAGIGNAGKSKIQGVEVDATLTPFTGMNLSFGYAYLDTELKSAVLPPPPPGFNAIINRAVVGAALPLVPKNKYSIAANYTLPIDESAGRLSFGATFTHQDSSFGSAASPPGKQFLPPQDNLNMNINWNGIAGGPVDASFFMTNVTNEKYFVSLIGASFGYDSAILSQPRMYGIRLKYSF